MMLQLTGSSLVLIAVLALFIFSPASASSAGEALRWPYNLPSNVKYYPENEGLVRREEDAQEILVQQKPTGVKKMSIDHGEKFFLDFWSFATNSTDGTMHGPGEQQRDTWDNVPNNQSNSVMSKRSTPPLLLHSRLRPSRPEISLMRKMRLPIAPRANLLKRDFDCPTGTSSCASIDRSTTCCGEGQTCQLIEDTGLGDVGCCDAGDTCAGGLSDCASGYTSCPGDDAGGCCIPGYACVSGGCLFASTATVLVTPSSTSVSLSSFSPAVLAPSLSRQTTEEIISTTTSTACSSGFRSCPATLGGGCCPTDRACRPDGCAELSSTATVGAPVRPTSAEPTTASEPSITGCPDGFYACSAIHYGGCCRYGRDCAPTSCPTSDLTALIDEDGVTIAAPSGSDLGINTLLTGDCAQGWSSCPANDGGGCCLSGYACGSSCTATATDPGVSDLEIAKIAPNSAKDRRGLEKLLLQLGTSLLTLLFLLAF